MADRIKYSLTEINALMNDDFVRVIGAVFENSPWITETASSQRPFATLTALHAALTQIVLNSGENQQVQLIQAHPDLVGRAALAGTLTPESNREQASAGLSELNPEEVAQFQNNNRAYREKFGFPFVMCARLNKKAAILQGFDTRQKHSREQEIKTALEEVGKIAWLRLQDIIATEENR